MCFEVFYPSPIPAKSKLFNAPLFSFQRLACADKLRATHPQLHTHFTRIPIPHGVDGKQLRMRFASLFFTPRSKTAASQNWHSTRRFRLKFLKGR